MTPNHKPPQLKLRRSAQEASHASIRDDAPRDVLPFPAERSRTGSLVAGRVKGRASNGHNFKPRFVSGDLGFAEQSKRGFDLAEPATDELNTRATLHQELVNSIDLALVDMQRRLDALADDTDRMKFPDFSRSDDQLPPAA